MSSTIQSEVERFLETGESDPLFRAWPGESLFPRAQKAAEELREALLAEVRRRAAGTPALPALVALDPVAFTRARVEPMVRGLFPRREQDFVLDVLGRSVLFLTPANLREVLHSAPDLRTAWELANLYLGSFGAERLGTDAPRIVGLSVGTTCYVSANYSHQESRFADFVVHEAAHVFHNCKRRTIGLERARQQEWLLEIQFEKRETFAYACEAYSRILALSRVAGEREGLLDELSREPMPFDDRVDPNEYLEILAGAVAVKDGWKYILRRCSSSSSPV
jgi:hypothetical protein